MMLICKFYGSFLRPAGKRAWSPRGAKGYGVNCYLEIMFFKFSVRNPTWNYIRQRLSFVLLQLSHSHLKTIYLLYSLIQVILQNFIQVYICCLKFRCFSFQVIKQASGFISGYIVGNILNLHQRSFNLHSCQFWRSKLFIKFSPPSNLLKHCRSFEHMLVLH